MATSPCYPTITTSPEVQHYQNSTSIFFVSLRRSLRRHRQSHSHLEALGVTSFFVTPRRLSFWRPLRCPPSWPPVRRRIPHSLMARVLLRLRMKQVVLKSGREKARIASAKSPRTREGELWQLIFST